MMRIWAVVGALASAALLALCGTSSAWAADPDLDPTYANAPIEPPHKGLLLPFASARYESGPLEGSIVIGGYTTGVKGGKYIDRAFILRLGPDGLPDRTFSDDGLRVPSFNDVWGGDSEPNGIINDLIIDGDGRIVATALTWPRSEDDPPSRNVVLGLNANGSRDTARDADPSSSFGRRGIAKVPCLAPQLAEYPRGGSGVAVGLDCRFASAAADDQHGALVLDENGDLVAGGDIEAGADWLLPHGVGPTEIVDMAVDSQERIVLVGRGAGNEGQAAARLTETGEIDSSFGSGGSVDVSGLGVITGVEVDSAGRLLLAARGRDQTDPDMSVGRYTPAGALDTGFGTGGVASVEAWPTGVMTGDVAVDDLGRILVAGSMARGRVGGEPEPIGFVSELFVVRLLPTGALDTGLSGDGIAEKGVVWPTYSYISSMSLDGRKPIVIGRVSHARGEIRRYIEAVRFQEGTGGSSG